MGFLTLPGHHLPGCSRNAARTQGEVGDGLSEERQPIQGHYCVSKPPGLRAGFARASDGHERRALRSRPPGSCTPSYISRFAFHAVLSSFSFLALASVCQLLTLEAFELLVRASLFHVCAPLTARAPPVTPGDGGGFQGQE